MIILSPNAYHLSLNTHSTYTEGTNDIDIEQYR